MENCLVDPVLFIPDPKSSTIAPITISETHTILKIDDREDFKHKCGLEGNILKFPGFLAVLAAFLNF